MCGTFFKLRLSAAASKFESFFSKAQVGLFKLLIDCLSATFGELGSATVIVSKNLSRLLWKMGTGFSVRLSSVKALISHLDLFFAGFLHKLLMSTPTLTFFYLLRSDFLVTAALSLLPAQYETLLVEKLKQLPFSFPKDLCELIFEALLTSVSEIALLLFIFFRFLVSFF